MRLARPVFREKQAPFLANSPASYWSLSGPPGPKSKKMSDKNLEKKDLFRDFFQTFRTFSTLFQTFWDPERRETFFRFFFFISGPRDSCSSREGSQPFSMKMRYYFHLLSAVPPLSHKRTDVPASARKSPPFSKPALRIFPLFFTSYLARQT